MKLSNDPKASRKIRTQNFYHELFKARCSAPEIYEEGDNVELGKSSVDIRIE